MRQWQVVVDAIRDADIIVVLGYSFPYEDQYGRFLFKEGARQRAKQLKKVEYYNIDRRSEAAIRDIFGDVKIEWKGKVTPANRRTLSLRRRGERMLVS
jgi:hypothetical protein